MNVSKSIIRIFDLDISRSNLDNFLQVLFLLLAFFLPISVSIAKIILITFLIVFVATGNFKEKISFLKKNYLSIFSILFFFCYILGILWTEDLQWGLIMLRKMADFFLFLPVLLFFSKRYFFDKAIDFFLVSIFLVCLLTLAVHFQIIEKLYKGSLGSPNVTMSHITAGVFYAFSLYIALERILSGKLVKNYSKFFNWTLVFILIYTLLISNSRTGFILLGLVLLITYINFNRGGILLGSIWISLILTIFFTLSYKYIPQFHDRTDALISNIGDYRSGKNYDTSVGQRLTWTLNSLEIIKDNFWFGVGTGDFNKEHDKIFQNLQFKVQNTVNPHNMYILVATQLGIFGLIALLSIFIHQIKFSLQETNKSMKRLGLFLPIMFIVINFGDSYLLGHFTTTLFIFFSSFLYKDFEKY